MPDEGDIFENIYGSATNELPNNPSGNRQATKDGVIGFTEAIGRDYEKYTAGFVQVDEIEMAEHASKPLGNLMRDLFKKVGPKLLRLPFATRNPLEMKGQKGWSELVDPVSALIPETAVPLGPISPDTRQRKLVPVITGKKGVSSHINILVDVSGSMGNRTRYATVVDDEGRLVNAGGRFSTRWVASLLVAQAKKLGDSFSIFIFGGGKVRSITRGASREYDEAVRWLQSEDEDYRLSGSDYSTVDMPFVSSGGTPLGLGIAAVNSTMLRNRRKIRGALTLAICDGSPDDGLSEPLTSKHENSYVERWKDDGTPVFADRDAYNPNNEPRLRLNDAFHRREFGPIIYVMVGGESNKTEMGKIAVGISCELQNFYNGTNYGAAQRTRNTPDGSLEVETKPMLGNDSRIGTIEADWTAWSWAYSPPYGNGLARAPDGAWENPGLRGPCLACGISFTISEGAIGLETFGGTLLAMARAGKGGDLQNGCFTKSRASL